MKLAIDVGFDSGSCFGYQSTIESLNAKLSQLEALLTIATSQEFLAYDKYIIYDYLWLIHDVVKQAQDECSELM